ncbi:CRISPR-associated endonuclease Cas1 [Gallibacterium anatis]|uniref:CRISPR-associated endonuclease Cas1 n=1 Tax=Gallibacterium anatis TaxID=750 RepID=A0A930Y501_9PAST|nr:CRISPR-associated endonuclease Cas1 [Gallibacterium anatis]
MFEARNRRPPRDPFNAILSLGYILHSQVVFGFIRKWIRSLYRFLSST